MGAFLRCCASTAIRRCGSALLLGLAAALFPLAVQAEPVGPAAAALPGSTIRFAGCSQTLQLEVNRLLPIEASDGWPGGRLTVFCLGDGRIEVRGEDGHVKRDLPVGASGEPHSGRTIALVLGELLRGPSDSQNEAAAAAAIVNAPVAAPHPPSSSPAPWRLSLLTFGQIAGDANRDAVPLGAGLGLGLDGLLTGPWLAAGVADVSFDRADSERTLGTARTETISTSLTVAAGQRWGRWQLGLGPLVRAGLVHIKGVSGRSDVIASEAWAPLLAPGARAEGVLWLGSVGVFASLEGSYGLSRSTGVVEGMAPVQVGGWSSLLRVGLRWRLLKS